MAVKQTIVEEVICDVCGEKADGHWSSVEMLNGELWAEMFCPLDLCESHMRIFAIDFTEYAEERYEQSRVNKEELVKKIKDNEYEYI
ncbi:hypothetical protein JTZ62_04770 [Mammaliicoccus sciuri]|uniref:hypothetical protein n=1 Tax=Mammaliicoccus sciuri TaxID=1296 RepID=UPI0019D3C71A|nr:hypothetical protein [Mammaliicoccus sciuri]QSN68472.1 hypothetical protein JTZ62_04770 [Mammaliicoccus sciuri]UIU23213.1 hypothetical protein LLZ87_04780 [Mammaliicoccus sciuri]UIU26118.1 hypothetical protein LLZ92_04780 [Mammaliicoccus sciuri]